MRRFVAGWDGGGTKTTVACIYEDGTELARKSFSAMNINGSTEDEVAECVKNACAFVAAQEGQCAGMAIATAGISNPRASKVVDMALRGADYNGKYVLRGDHEAALYGAVGGVGLVLVAGTGSICFGRNAAGKTARCGGFGNIIDDAGSGYAIGREILIAVARAEDGRAKPTFFSEKVYSMEKWRDIPTILRTLYTDRCDKSEVAALATLLSPALAAGDYAALGIAERAADELALLCATTADKLDLREGRAAFTGSILEHVDIIREGVKARLGRTNPGLVFTKPERDAAYGAALMALEAFVNKA